MSFERVISGQFTGVLSRHFLSITDNLLPDLVEIVELLSRQMQELSPFIRVILVQLHLGDTVLWLVRLGFAIGFGARRSVDELQDLFVSSLRFLWVLLTSGRRVTIPVPRGRKSRPTMFYLSAAKPSAELKLTSSTEDLPLLWDPMTVICGRS